MTSSICYANFQSQGTRNFFRFIASFKKAIWSNYLPWRSPQLPPPPFNPSTVLEGPEEGGGGWQLWRDYLIGGIFENFPTDNGPVKRKDYFLMLPRLPSKSQNVNLKINTPVKRLGLKYRYQVGCCTYRKRESCAVNTSRRRNKHTAPKTQYSV